MASHQEDMRCIWHRTGSCEMHISCARRSDDRCSDSTSFIRNIYSKGVSWNTYNVTATCEICNVALAFRFPTSGIPINVLLCLGCPPQPVSNWPSSFHVVILATVSRFTKQICDTRQKAISMSVSESYKMTAMITYRRKGAWTFDLEIVLETLFGGGVSSD